MFYLFLLLTVLLAFALIFSVLKSGRFAPWAKAYRIAVVSISLSIITVLFIRKSVDQFRENALTVQVINKLPIPLDFYIIKVNKDADPETKYEAKHVGNIRTNFYRNEYADMKNSDEFWIAALRGKNTLVYFSQHSVPNKNEDQILEIRNYVNQSLKLSDIAKTQIASMNFENMKTAIWLTLALLLIFLNLVLLLRKDK